MSEAWNGVFASMAEKVLASCWPGLVILLEAFESAKELHYEVWEFAVEIQNLRRAGLSGNDLRWLLCKGYVEHAIENTQPKAAQRTFQSLGNLMLGETSCFVLTRAGVTLVCGGNSAVSAGHDTPNLFRVSSGRETVLVPKVPRWDAACRELSWGQMVVKRFRLPASNQELVLAAFEEDGWPRHIDDPLSHPLDCDPHQRLHDTIKRLNRHQVNPLIRFRANGSGNGIFWELCI